MFNLPYQKLKIWQFSFELVREIYQVTKIFPVEERYGLTQQIRRAVVSVPSNIAEGSQRTTKKDFYSFIAIARGSLAEVETQLLLAIELNYIEKADLDVIQNKIFQLKKMLFSFQKTLL